MQKAVLKPSKAGLKVMDPQTGLHLSPEGKEVPLTNYWRRRIICGDCIEVKTEPKAVKVQTKKTNNKNESEE
jgi:hypothetical protein